MNIKGTDQKYSSDIASLRKNIDMFSLRLKRVRNRNADLEAQLNHLSPKKSQKAIFDLGEVKRLKALIAQLEQESKECEKTMDFFEQVFDECRSPLLEPRIETELEPKVLIQRRSKSELTQLGSKTQGKGALPPISVMKLGSGKVRKAEYVSDQEKLTTLFGTADMDKIDKLFSEVKRRNSELKEKSEVLDAEIVGLESYRDQLLQDIIRMGNKRLDNDIAQILDHYKEISIEENREATKSRERMLKLKEMIVNLGQKVGVIPEGSLVEILKHIRNKIEESTLNGRAAAEDRMKQAVDTSILISNRDVSIPSLNLGSICGSETFLGQSRSMRRAFSTLTPKEPSTNVFNSDFEAFGEFLGAVYIERYAAAMNEKTYDVEVEQNRVVDKLPNIVIKETEAPELYRDLFQRYINESDNLSGLFFSISEAEMDQNLRVLIGFRNAVIQLLHLRFSMPTLIENLLPLFGDHTCAACWIVRDLCGSLIDNEKDLEFFFERIIWSLKRVVQSLERPETVKKNDVIAMLACLERFMEIQGNNGIHTAITEMVEFCGERCVHLFEQLATRDDMRGMMAVFKIGRYCPKPFSSCLVVRTISLLQRWFLRNTESTSCLKVTCSFIGSALEYCDQDCRSWHMAWLFHLFQQQIYKSTINVEKLLTITYTVTNLVASRKHNAVEQLLRLHVLRFVIHEFELEQFLAAEPVHPPEVKEVKSEKPNGISYLDIPKLAIPLPVQIPSLNLDNPKLQLHFRPKAGSNVRLSMSITELQYSKKRKKYIVYLSQDLHIALICLFFALIMDNRLHRLDVNFCDPFPEVNRKPNVLFTLMQHMESSFNKDTIAGLSAAFEKPLSRQDTGGKSSVLRSSYGIDLVSSGTFMEELTISEIEIAQDYERLLRLTVPEKFNPERYSHGDHIASGAFGAVMAVQFEENRYAVKILQKSKTELDNPHLIEVYTEVSILERCKGDRRVTQIFDYGCTCDSYYIVMEFYPHTLKSWRKSLDVVNLGTILRVYREFLNATTILMDHRINHYDIKCDNVMLDSNGMPALADFGESLSWTDEHNCYSLLNRGTEWIKSPEMLSIALNSAISNPNYDRRRKVGAGPASDVWSIGCLFYELLTGDFLFVDNDWSRFFLRITTPNEPILNEENIKKLPPDPRFSKFIEFVLQRNASQRPTVNQVIAKFDETFPEGKTSPLPVISTSHSFTEPDVE